MIFSCTNYSEKKTEVNNDKESILVPEFNADTAYSYIANQVQFGPRIPNSQSHKNCKAYLSKTLKQFADTVYDQQFNQNVYGKDLLFTNIIASFNSTKKERIVLCAHWDSRPYADEDKDISLAVLPILGANDGASGVSILIELARQISLNNPDVGIDFILFDGEDYGKSHDRYNYFIGSRFIAEHYPLQKPKYAILLDLVGDKDAQFRFDPLSLSSHEPLLRSIWDIAKELGFSQFKSETGNGVADDHEMLINAGIKSINIIDVQLVGNIDENPRRKYWHTSKDNMDNIGKETLYAVGQTLLTFIYTKSMYIY
ncbi:glutamine cyclotransferase [Chlorobiota bacterium]|nr:glutamine cyclotransferase [Chlorobiota bacterium]